MLFLVVGVVGLELLVIGFSLLKEVGVVVGFVIGVVGDVV